MERIDGVLLIDDVARDDLRSALSVEEHAGKRCPHLSGAVRLDNNGDFVQMALDLDADGGLLDARGFHADLRLAELTLYREPVVCDPSTDTGP